MTTKMIVRYSGSDRTPSEELHHHRPWDKQHYMREEEDTIKEFVIGHGNPFRQTVYYTHRNSETLPNQLNNGAIANDASEHASCIPGVDPPAMAGSIMIASPGRPLR